MDISMFPIYSFSHIGMRLSAVNPEDIIGFKMTDRSVIFKFSVTAHCMNKQKRLYSLTAGKITGPGIHMGKRLQMQILKEIILCLREYRQYIHIAPESVI
jgi:hypothetical protein